MRAEGLVDVVAGGDEECRGEDESEGGEGCGVEDAEEWNMGTGGGDAETEMHCSDIDGVGMAVGKDAVLLMWWE